MTDKTVVKWPIMQIGTLLRLKKAKTLLSALHQWRIQGEGWGGCNPHFGKFSNLSGYSCLSLFHTKHNIVSYNMGFSPIDHYKKTVAIPLLDSLIIQITIVWRRSPRPPCALSRASIIVNKALELDDEVEGMLFWEKDIPFLNPLEMRYVDGKQSGSQQIYWELPNNLLLAFGVGYEDAFRNISRLLVIACTLPTTRAEAEPPFHWWNESRPALGQQWLQSNSLISQWLPRTIFREIRGGGRRDTPASLCNGSSKKALSS